VLRIIKFALPLAALFCFGTLADGAEKKRSSSSKSRSSSESGSKKKSRSKKSAKSSRSSSKSAKAKSKARGGKTKADVAKVSSSASLDWIDELPDVELPEVAGPPEDELLEPVTEPELEPLP